MRILLENILAEREEIEEGLGKTIATGLLGAGLLFNPVTPRQAEAKPVASQNTQLSNLWKGLIGEDVSGGYEGMYAVACVVKNRLAAGMNLGLVALKRPDLDTFVNKEPEKYHIMAKEIVKKVFEENGKDITNGATHYENIEKYGMPSWAKGMKVVAKIGEHTFFK